MPIYEYKCEKCSSVEEHFLLRTEDKEPKECKICKGELQKLISRNSFELKGTGWYTSDYARKSPKKA